ncbi:hypothetical protein CEXT_310651 [Caerostris extrusa]|uniref:Uncharacterized protein n=1 Tax=Caerostris extrusa TaxID=172846 RepID=A0AAV4MRF4_CAEEX|nr:hypothetical protein CEXT_310651 [Caerostris extrusa]
MRLKDGGKAIQNSIAKRIKAIIIGTPRRCLKLSYQNLKGLAEVMPEEKKCPYISMKSEDKNNVLRIDNGFNPTHGNLLGSSHGVLVKMVDLPPLLISTVADKPRETQVEKGTLRQNRTAEEICQLFIRIKFPQRFYPKCSEKIFWEICRRTCLEMIPG